jgi:general secretion pathway protein D
MGSQLVMKKHVLSLMIALCLGAGAAQAQEPTSRDAAMRINLKDVEISQVADAVAEITGKNFVIDPRVKAKVSFVTNKSMQPQQLYQTFLALLKVHGFAALETGDLVEIVPVNMVRDRAQRVISNQIGDADEWVTEVISLKYVSANKLVSLLRPLIANEGHLVANPDSNRLIVTDRIANIGRLKDIVSRVDVPFQHSYEVVSLKYLGADEAVTLLKSLNTGVDREVGLIVAPDTRANRIILSGGEAQRLSARTLLAQLDTPVQNQGRVQVVYLQYAKAADLAPILQNIAGASSTLAASEQTSVEGNQPATVMPPVPAPNRVTSKGKSEDDVSIEADERMNALVISAPPQLIATLREVIHKLDVRRAQVIIEAVIAEISEDQTKQFGASWVASGPNGAGVISLDDVLPKLVAGATDPTGAAAASAISGVGVAGAVGQTSGNSGWGAFLRALKSNTDSNILSTPTLVTMDNEEASMIVGQEVPFSTGSYSNTGMMGATTGTIGSPFQTIKRQDVGLKLKVKPQINEGNSIRLEIEQSVSSLVPNSRQSLGSVDLVTSKREIKTNVLVNDGNVVVLGGLIDESETEALTKVPGLGDIPFLGGLFSYKSNKLSRRNLMVFLRPRILRDDQLANSYAAAKYKTLQTQAQGLSERKQTNDREIASPSLPDDIDQLLILPPAFEPPAGGSSPEPVPDRGVMRVEPLGE